jgi:primosomal protein N' (replication factor Y)
MFYYEVLLADAKYRSAAPLTYSSEEPLPLMSVVTVPLRQRLVSGFILSETGKPGFAVKPVRALLSDKPLPHYCLELAQWLSEYYASSLGEALRQYAPSKPAVRQIKTASLAALDEVGVVQLEMQTPLTEEQKRAVQEIKDKPSTTVLLHGETGSGKTRV